MWNWPSRLARLVFLSAFCTVLGYYFLWENHIILPSGIRNWVGYLGLAIPQPSDQLYHLEAPRINPDELLSFINTHRQEANLDPVTLNPELTKVAELLLKSLAQDEYQLESKDYNQVLQTHLDTVGYQFKQATDLALIGKNTTNQVIQEWQLPAYQDLISNPDLSQVGIGLTTPFIEGVPVGAVVLVMAEPIPQVTLQNESEDSLSETTSLEEKSSPSTITATIKPIYHPTDDEVMVDLNKYRAAHRVPNLLIDQHLCQYAEKRASDLKSFGGLDGHQGFHDDFSSGEPPLGIRDYPGGAVAENLASQYCLNTQTNQSFVAESGAALVEWCFDSSTSGHREAQLNPSYTSACVRHSDHLYVIIFGE